MSGRPVEVRRLRRASEARECNVLFVAGPARATQEALAQLRGSSTLTVGDSPEFAHEGGVIRLYLVDDRVRFEINVDAAERAHLTISSKLLVLAHVVRDGPRKEGG